MLSAQTLFICCFCLALLFTDCRAPKLVVQSEYERRIAQRWTIACNETYLREHEFSLAENIVSLPLVSVIDDLTSSLDMCRHKTRAH